MGFLPVLRNSSPRPRHFWFAKPRPAATLPGQERVKGAKMAGLFCSPGHHAEAALCLRGRGQGSAALSGSLPRPSLLPCAPEPREPSGPGCGGSAARPTLRHLGASAAPGGGWPLRPPAGHPQPGTPSRPPGSFPAAPRLQGAAIGVATVPSSGSCAEQHAGPSEPLQTTWAQTAGSVLSRWLSHERALHFPRQFIQT